MTVDLNLPTFGLDCRQWLVATEADGLVIEETDDAPVVAVLSTALVVSNELVSARAVLSLALLDDQPYDDSHGDDSHGDDSHGDDSHDDDSHDDDYHDADDAETHAAINAADACDGFDAEQWRAQDICVLEVRWSDGYARFAVPAPGGELAVVAEFTSAPDPSSELIDRFYDLVTSFRWAA